MDEAIKYIFANFEMLRAPQWILIILISTGIGALAFFVLKWLYSERYEAQNNLISLKEDIILTYSTNMDQLKDQAKYLEHQVEKSQQEINSYLDSLIQVGKEKEVLKRVIYNMYKDIWNLKLMFFQLERMRLYWFMIGNYYSMLFIYSHINVNRHVKDSKESYEIYKNIESATDTLKSVKIFPMTSDKDDPLNMKKPVMVIPELIAFDFKTLDVQLKLVENDLLYGLNILFKK